MSIVLGRGNPHARGVIVGEAPGAEEEKQGRPFVGPSGAILSEALTAAGLDEERDVWITNVVKERPENNRTPYNSEVSAAREALLAELASVGPVAVLAVGNVARLALTGEGGGIVKARGTWDTARAFPGAPPLPVLPTLHPAYTLHNGGRGRAELFADVVEFAARIFPNETPRGGSMSGFFDEYKEIGGAYVSAEEKEVLKSKGIPFQIVDVLDDDESQYGARFALQVIIPDADTGEPGEPKIMAFKKGTVDSRDRMLRQMQEYLAREDAQPVIVKLEQVGRSQIIRNATPAEA